MQVSQKADSSVKEVQYKRRFVEPTKMQPVVWPVKN